MRVVCACSVCVRVVCVHVVLCVCVWCMCLVHTCGACVVCEGMCISKRMYS